MGFGGAPNNLVPRPRGRRVEAPDLLEEVLDRALQGVVREQPRVVELGPRLGRRVVAAGEPILIARRSYEWPSAAMHGSSMGSIVIGHKYASGISRCCSLRIFLRRWTSAWCAVSDVSSVLACAAASSRMSSSTRTFLPGGGPVAVAPRPPVGSSPPRVSPPARRAARAWTRSQTARPPLSRAHVVRVVGRGGPAGGVLGGHCPRRAAAAASAAAARLLSRSLPKDDETFTTTATTIRITAVIDAAIQSLRKNKSKAAGVQFKCPSLAPHKNHLRGHKNTPSKMKRFQTGFQSNSHWVQ